MNLCTLFQMLFYAARRRITPAVVWCVFISGAPLYAENSIPVAPIKSIQWNGWTNAIRLNNKHVDVILVPETGRLTHFSLQKEESLLRLDAGLAGKTPDTPEHFFNAGGDWLWPVSQAKWADFSKNKSDWPPPAVMADAGWDASAWKASDGAQYALLTRTYGEPLNIKASRLFQLEPQSAVLKIRQTIERIAPSDIPVTLWNVSQVALADDIIFPVRDDSAFKKGVRALMGRVPGKERLLRCDAAALYRVTPGSETKLGVDAALPWVAAIRGNNALIEFAENPSISGATYPDGGCSVEIYSNHGLGYTEIEILSPEVLLEQGNILENTLRLVMVSLPGQDDSCGKAEWIHQQIQTFVATNTPAKGIQTPVALPETPIPEDSPRI